MNDDEKLSLKINFVIQVIGMNSNEGFAYLWKNPFNFIPIINAVTLKRI